MLSRSLLILTLALAVLSTGCETTDNRPPPVEYNTP